MLAQPLYSPPPNWYLLLVCALYPLIGFVLIGEGIVRFSLLMISRRQGEAEWMKVMASTYRDHVILCGLGHLGYRVLEQLVKSNVSVVAIESDGNGRFVPLAKATGAPILIRDMKEDQALLDAGIEHARAIIIATNDDMANLEVAMDARRYNPTVRITTRLYDQQIAAKLSDTLIVDAAYSPAALAAPFVAALALAAKVTPSTVIAGEPHVTSEIAVPPTSPWISRRLGEIEKAHAMRVLARTPKGGAAESPPSLEAAVQADDVLVVHCRVAALLEIVSAQERELATASA
jgi:voltage-gated potassium channel